MIAFADKQFMQFRNIKETTYHRTHLQNSERQQYQPQHIQPKIYNQPQFQQPSPVIQRPPEPLKKNTNNGFGMASMEQLNQDLNRLKSQLQRLSEQEKEEEFRRTSGNRQQLYDSKARARSNLSADNSMARGRQQPQSSFRSPFETTNIRFITSVQEHNQASPTKSSCMSKVVPIVNPNKRQRERKVFTPREQSPRREDLQRVDKNQSINIAGRDQEQIQRVMTQNKYLKEQLESAKLQIEQLKAKAIQNSEQSKTELATMTKKIEEDRLQYQTVLIKLQEDIARTRKDHQLTQSPSFDQTLKLHLQQQEKTSRLLQQRTEEVASLQEHVAQQARQIDRLKAELSLRELKNTGQLKAKIQRQQMQLKQVSNDLQSNIRNLQTVQQRYKAATREIQQKDEFILKYFVGRASDKEQQSIRQMLAQYKEALTRQSSLFFIITNSQKQRLE